MCRRNVKEHCAFNQASCPSKQKFPEHPKGQILTRSASARVSTDTLPSLKKKNSLPEECHNTLSLFLNHLQVQHIPQISNSLSKNFAPV